MDKSIIEKYIIEQLRKQNPLYGKLLFSWFFRHLCVDDVSFVEFIAKETIVLV